MPVLVAALWGAFLTIIGSVVGKVLLALGISYVAYSGFDLAINALLNSIKTNFDGLPAEVVGFLAWLWVDRAIGMLFSAYSVAMAFRLAGTTILKKAVMK